MLVRPTYSVKWRSEAASASPFLLSTLLRSVSLEAQLNRLTLIADIHTIHLIIIHISAESVMAGDGATILSLRIIVATALISCGRLHTDVLDLELFRGELIQEVLLSDETALLVGILKQDLVEPLNDGLHHLLEAEAHGFLILIVRTNVLLELLINLLDDPIEPVTHIRVSQLDFLRHLNGLLVELLG